MLNVDLVFVSVSAARIPRLGSFPRFSADKVTSQWADAVIDNAGYASIQDRVLAFHNEPGITRRFPTADEFRARGVDVVKLAACIEEGLFVVESFGGTVQRLSTDDLNGSLENLLEASEAYQAHPTDALDRAMHRQNCCGCC